MNNRTIFLSVACSAVLIEASTGALLGGNLDIQIPNTFAAGTPARASEVNANFAAIETTVEDFSLTVDSRLTTLENQSSSSSLERVITVAASGADFASVVNAVDSITDASSTNRYLVQVGPGVFDEIALVDLPAFVTLKGSGIDATVIRSARTSASSNSGAAVVQLANRAGILDLSIENTGASQTSIGIIGSEISADSTIRFVRVAVDGAGGQSHTAVDLTDSDALLEHVDLLASGATSSNVALRSSDTGGPFAQPIIKASRLEGDNPANGIGARLASTAARFEDTTIIGDSIGIEAETNGISRLFNCSVRTLGFNPVYSQTGSAAILSALVEFIGGNPDGSSTQFKYVHCVKPNLDPVLNGFGSTVQ